MGILGILHAALDYLLTWVKLVGSHPFFHQQSHN